MTTRKLIVGDQVFGGKPAAPAEIHDTHPLGCPFCPARFGTSQDYQDHRFHHHHVEHDWNTRGSQGVQGGSQGVQGGSIQGSQGIQGSPFVNDSYPHISRLETTESCIGGNVIERTIITREIFGAAVIERRSVYSINYETGIVTMSRIEEVARSVDEFPNDADDVAYEPVIGAPGVQGGEPPIMTYRCGCEVDQCTCTTTTVSPPPQRTWWRYTVSELIRRFQQETRRH